MKNRFNVLKREVVKIVNHKIRRTYSQYGEDLVLSKLLLNKDNGFYVDIGANDPINLSNTYRFYQKGWSGINIEPNPLNYQKLLSNRFRDINLNIGVADVESSGMCFYIIDPHELSTFSEMAAEKAIEDGYKVERKISIETKKLSTVLNSYSSQFNHIDFMSIDVEGHELNVLGSNDWKLFRPSYVLVEINRNECAINRYMAEQNYKVLYDNRTNKIYSSI